MPIGHLNSSHHQRILINGGTFNALANASSSISAATEILFAVVDAFVDATLRAFLLAFFAAPGTVVVVVAVDLAGTNVVVVTNGDVGEAGIDHVGDDGGDEFGDDRGADGVADVLADVVADIAAGAVVVAIVVTGAGVDDAKGLNSIITSSFEFFNCWE